MLGGTISYHCNSDLVSKQFSLQQSSSLVDEPHTRKIARMSLTIESSSPYVIYQSYKDG